MGEGFVGVGSFVNFVWELLCISYEKWRLQFLQKMNNVSNNQCNISCKWPRKYLWKMPHIIVYTIVLMVVTLHHDHGSNHSVFCTYCCKNRITCQYIFFHSSLDFDFLSLQFKCVLKCNKCQDNVMEKCLHVPAESLVNIWMNWTFADIFKYQIKKVFNDGRNDYAIRIVSITWCYEFVTM